MIPLTYLFAEKEEQPAYSAHQQRGVEDLNSSVRQLLASWPVDIDSSLADGRLLQISLTVIQDEYVEPRCKIDYHTVRQQGSRRGGV